MKTAFLQLLPVRDRAAVQASSDTAGTAEQRDPDIAALPAGELDSPDTGLLGGEIRKPDLGRPPGAVSRSTRFYNTAGSEQV